ERGLGDAQQKRASRGRAAAVGDHPLVLFAEAEFIHLLLEQERGVAHVFYLHPAHHLPDDYFNVLVADGHTLESIHFLDFVHQVSLQLLLTKHGKNVVRVERAVHERLAGAHALTFLHVDVYTTGHGIFLLRAVIGHDVDFTLAFGNFAELHHAIDLTDDGGLARLAGLKQLNHARQTTGDVFGLGGVARDLGQHVARMDFISVLHHQVGPGRHQVTPRRLAFDDQRRLAFLVRRLAHDVARESGDFVHFLMQRDALLQVFELHLAADFRKDGK